jgi:hypothetical protein
VTSDEPPGLTTVVEQAARRLMKARMMAMRMAGSLKMFFPMIRISAGLVKT